jgi:hypothetical protein
VKPSTSDTSRIRRRLKKKREGKKRGKFKPSMFHRKDSTRYYWERREEIANKNRKQ